MYWSFRFSISPSHEHSGLISLRIDWFGLLAVQGTLKSLLQHHNSKATILQCSAVFIDPVLTSIREGNGNPLQHSCLENPMDGGLVGCSPWDHEESDTTEQLHFSLPCIGEGNGNPLQCSCLENPRDCEAWWVAIYGVTQSQTWLKQRSSSSSHPYMTTGKTVALTRWTFVSKVVSLLFNMLSMFVITFLPRSKRLLISWLQSLSTVIWSPRK